MILTLSLAAFALAQTNEIETLAPFPTQCVPPLISPLETLWPVQPAAIYWTACPQTSSYEVFLGTSRPLPRIGVTADTYFTLPVLSPGRYEWYVVAQTTSGPGATTIRSFEFGTGLNFTPITPCRAVDTRLGAGAIAPAFGAPHLAAGTVRNFPLTLSACGLPADSLAYSMNVTLVPRGGPVYFITVWPMNGASRPLVSLLNSADGVPVSVGTIQQTGPGGGITIYTTNDTDVAVDVNGYFSPRQGLHFYPLTPCRIADTRGAQGPSLAAGETRTIPVRSAACGVPQNALAYALNFTAVPASGLAFLTAWPTGQQRPFVSTLNAFRGGAVANAAILPAGGNGNIDVFVTDRTDLVIDVNGYFAPPGGGGHQFYATPACRVGDTRTATPPAQGGQPSLAAGETRRLTFSGCSPSVLFGWPLSYVLNVTVVPSSGPLGFLALWPAGQPRPLASALNSWQGTIVSNMVIVHRGSGNSIESFVTDATDVIYDLGGVFSP